jgi:hypothetical protein
MKYLKSLTGKWKGEFILGTEYDDDMGETTFFELEINDDSGTITGICIEEDSKKLFLEPITINGFWNDDLISFVKQYPCLFYKDEAGNIILDKSKKHPPISYSGQFDKLLNRFEGEFELVMDSIRLTGGYLEWELTGTWMMRRAED